jgi:penicillin G amidase
MKCRWLIVVGAGVALSILAKASELPTQDRVVLDGLNASTEILIDRWGVPHIYATTIHDAFFAQGWNAARDRLWQIDLWRRSGLGELAAVLGRSYVAQDRAIRLFVYRGDIKQEWAAYGPEAKRNTGAFVQGINAYIAAAKSNNALLPPEFKLAGFEPAFWKADDIVRIRNHGLTGTAELQVLRAQLVCKGGFPAAELLLKISPPWTPVVAEGLDICSIPPNVLDQYQLAQQSIHFDSSGKMTSAAEVEKPIAMRDNNPSEHSQGSNNWAIAPSRTSTGRPILANDPHRGYEVPSLRYLVHVVAPGLNIIGAGEPALPGVSIGHNTRIAFGLTVFPIAGEDLYVYDTNPENPNEYRYRGAWESMRVLHETVAVRGGRDSEVELKFTRHGPVVMEDPRHLRAYAVRAAWLDTGGAPYFGSMWYLRAQNIRQFSSALKHWGEPGENQVYADTSGRIGWFPSGFTPVRTNSDGLLPLPGDGRYEWSGFLDHELLPSEIDPARGFISTANQMNLPKEYPYAQRRVGFTWADDFRIDRINEVIGGLPKSSILDSQELQNDYVSLPGRRLVGVLSSIPTSDPVLQEVIRWLGGWDKRIVAESPQAALFEIWVARHLGLAVVAQAANSMPENLQRLVSGNAATIVALLEHPDERFGTDPEKTRDKLMLDTLAAALKETQQRLGPDRSTWQWGRLATALFEHQLSPLADAAQRAQMNVGPAPKSGDGSVVSAVGYRSTDFRAEGGASFRMVLDVGHWDESVAVNTPGQSGALFSAHYGDLFPTWLSGGYFPLLFSRPAIEKAAERRIRLVPR